MLEKRKTDVIGKTPDRVFEWRTARGEFIPVNAMVTRHLFNTVKMVWNNFMPPDARIEPCKLYTLTAPYTNDYLKSFLKNAIPVLLVREDLTPWQKKKLRKMYLYFANKYEQDKIPEAFKLLEK